MSGRTGVRL